MEYMIRSHFRELDTRMANLSHRISNLDEKLDLILRALETTTTIEDYDDGTRRITETTEEAAKRDFYKARKQLAENHRFRNDFRLRRT